MKINVVVIYPFTSIVTFFMGGISFYYIKYRLNVQDLYIKLHYNTLYVLYLFALQQYLTILGNLIGFTH